MNTKLILLAAGALTALAVAGSPSATLAGEITADCEVGPPCTALVQSTGTIEFAGENAETTSCTSVVAGGTLTSGSSTTSVQLQFHGCKELATPFKFPCTSPGQAMGTVTTNPLIAHNVYLEPDKATPGILLTNVNMTFACGGVNRMFKGNILGHIENPACNTFQSHHTIAFEKVSEGRQKYSQVTTSGTVFELLKSNDPEGVQETVSATGTVHVTYNQQVKLTC